MTRFKKEVRKAGYKLNCDYPYLPFNELENVCCFVRDGANEKCIVMCRDYVFGTETIKFDRSLNITFDFD